MSAIDPEATVVDLVNLDAEQDRTVIIQSGAFAEHTIEEVRYTACSDPSWIGGLYDYGHGEPVIAHKQAGVGGPWLTVRLPASTQIRMTIRLGLRARTPSYVTPFDGSPHGEGTTAASAASDNAPATATRDPAGQAADGLGVP